MSKLPHFRRRPSKKQLSVRRRHLGATSRMRMEISRLYERISIISKLIGSMRRANRYKNIKKIYKLKKLLQTLLHEALLLDSAPAELFNALPKIRKLTVTIDSFDDEEIPIYFRFDNKDQLRRLVSGFKFPIEFKLKYGHKFTGEEVLLVGLYRLHRPTSILDACWKHRFHLSYSQVSKVFTCFIEYMTSNWEHLLTNNMNYWLQFFPTFTEAIRKRCALKGAYFEPGNLRVFVED
jgi:hypothetical protein